MQCVTICGSIKIMVTMDRITQVLLVASMIELKGSLSLKYDPHEQMGRGPAC